MKNTIPYNRHLIDNEDIAEVARVLKSEFLTTGPEAGKFEKSISQYCGSKYAVVCSNGTAALHLAMKAIKITDKDYVITSANTFVADSNAPLFEGGKVIFADIESTTGNICFKSLTKLLERNRKVKCVIATHFAGLPIDMSKLKSICNKYGVIVIEDGCHALGASYKDKYRKKNRVGNCSNSLMTTFSFHPIKSITTGEGGAITTNNKNIYKQLLKLRNHGIVRNNFIDKKQSETTSGTKKIKNAWYYELQSLSNNYRLTDFQAALGRSQIKKLDKFIKIRQQLAKKYDQAIKKYSKNFEIEKLQATNGIFHSYHLYCIKINFSTLIGGRAMLMNYLFKKNINTQVHYIPIYKFPFYKKYFKRKISLTETEKHYDTTLSLPLYVSMKIDMPDKIIKLIVDYINKHKK